MHDMRVVKRSGSVTRWIVQEQAVENGPWEDFSCEMENEQTAIVMAEHWFAPFATSTEQVVWQGRKS